MAGTRNQPPDAGTGRRTPEPVAGAGTGRRRPEPVAGRRNRSPDAGTGRRTPEPEPVAGARSPDAGTGRRNRSSAFGLSCSAKKSGQRDIERSCPLRQTRPVFLRVVKSRIAALRVLSAASPRTFVAVARLRRAAPPRFPGRPVRCHPSGMRLQVDKSLKNLHEAFSERSGRVPDQTRRGGLYDHAQNLWRSKAPPGTDVPAAVGGHAARPSWTAWTPHSLAGLAQHALGRSVDRDADPT